MKSTQAMRDRIRELMSREQDDYDRAVECVLDDLESLIPDAAQPATEYAWLIEAGWTGTASIEYWCGCEVTGGGGVLHQWSFDHSRAIRFARKEDAKRITSILIEGEAYRIVEHGWDTAQPTAAPVETDAVEGELDTLVQLIHKHVGIRQRIDVDLTGVEDAAKAILATLHPRSSVDSAPLLARKQALGLAIAIFRYGTSKGYGSDAIDKALLATTNLPPGPPMRPREMEALFPGAKPAVSVKGWLHLKANRVLSVDRGNATILCDRGHPTELMVLLAEPLPHWGSYAATDDLIERLHGSETRVDAIPEVTCYICKQTFKKRILGAAHNRNYYRCAGCL